MPELRLEGHYDQAARVARSNLEARRQDGSSAPWQIADAERLVKTLEQIARLPEPARAELAEIDRLLAEVQGRPEQVVTGGELASLERMLKTRARYLGDAHPETADLMLVVAPSIGMAGDTDRAETWMRRVLEIRRSRLGPDHPGVIQAQLALARLLIDNYRHSEADALAVEALETAHRLFGEMHPDTARALVVRGSATDRRNDAIELYRKSLAILQATLGEDHPEVASTLVALGKVLDAGYQGEGERCMRKALAIQRRHLAPDSATLAATLNALGEAVRWQGEPHEAIELYREAGEIYARALGENHYAVGLIANNIAMAYRKLGDYEAARPLLEKAAALYGAALGPTHGATMTVRANVAMNQANLGNLEAAERMLRELLAEWNLHLDTSDYFLRGYLSRVLERRGNYAGAEAIERELFDERVAKDGSENTSSASQSLENLGRLRAARGDLERAEQFLSRSARAWEASRGNAGTGTKAATFKQSPYEYLAVARLERGNPDSAWPAVERARGRVLLDLLSEPGSAAGLAAPFDLERVQAAIPDATALVGWLDFRLHPKAPRYWAYVIRTTGPVVWVRLPTAGHETVEALAADLREFRNAVSSVAESTLGAGPPPTEEAHRQWSTRFAPLETHLKGVERLVVVPSWAMGGVPVEAMVDSAGRYVGERFAVTYAVSATTYAWFRTTRRSTDSRVRTALLLGDPSFHLGPPATASTVEVATLRSGLRGDRKALDRLPRLPWSRREVQGIAHAFADPVVLVGEHASETALTPGALARSLSGFDVIHLATHALMDNERPERSGLVLSQVGLSGSHGDGGIDGIITGSEIMERWKLDAELVTLSACQTALGRNIQGEGVVGLSYPFLKAGARALLVSLWKVDDEATALLMQRFYDAWLGGRDEEGGRGMSKSEALAEAKRHLREYTDPSGGRPFEHPFYWSAFVLVGDPD